MAVLTGIDEIRAHEGEELGVSDWYLVRQEEIDAFADVTGDHQWIHVDTERAAASPFGGTIAHGYYTLTIAPKLAEGLYAFDGFEFGLNYGLNRVRYPAPLPVGERVRLRARLSSVEDVPRGIQIVVTQTFEREGGEKPVCVADQVIRLYPDGL